MATALYRRLIQSEVLRTLGRLYPDQYGASLLLVPLGADMARLPPFGTLPPEQWWFGALTTIDYGAFEFGLDGLVEAVLAQFPGASELARASDGASTAGKTQPLRVLCLLASPSDQSRLSLAEEQREITQIGRRDQLVVTVHTATRTSDLAPALLAAQADVVHFAGHGDAAGRLIFHNEMGRSAPVSASALGKMLESTGELKCCVLNSCYSGEYAEALLGGAHAVIGSVEMLRDVEAMAFDRGFYAGLAAGRTTLQAYLIGLAEMELGDMPTGKMRYVDRAGTSMRGRDAVPAGSPDGRA
jgi:hypothetical protein